jgi:large subunit ribosomal protein L15
MALTANNITPAHGAKRTSKRLGRGNGSQKGTFSGRGLKGQRSRSGGKSGTLFRGFKANLQKVPKLRGFKSIHAKPHTVTLAMLNRAMKDNDIVTPGLLVKRGLISSTVGGVKIVATGELSKKLVIKGCSASASATKQIEAAGGTFTE